MAANSMWGRLYVLLMPDNDDSQADFGKLLAAAKGGNREALDAMGYTK